MLEEGRRSFGTGRDTERARGGIDACKHSHHVHTYTCHVMPTYTYIRKCCLRVSWQGPHIVAQHAQCPEYFIMGTLLMHMLHTAPRLYNWPARCVSTDRSNMLLSQTRRHEIHHTSAFMYEWREKNPSRSSFSTPSSYEFLDSLHHNSSLWLICTWKERFCWKI